MADFPALASTGSTAALGWFAAETNPDETVVQRLDHALPMGAAVQVPNSENLGAHRTVAWTSPSVVWMGAESTLDIEGLLLSATDVVARGTVARFVSCVPDCLPTEPQYADVRYLHAVAWQDELWLGFWDASEEFTMDWHPVAIAPYRVLRVKDGCSYPLGYRASLGQ